MIAGLQHRQPQRVSQLSLCSLYIHPRFTLAGDLDLRTQQVMYSNGDMLPVRLQPLYNDLLVPHTTCCTFVGRVCNVSDVPLLCSAVNWSAGEAVVGSSDHALYAVDVQTGKKRRTLYSKTAGHAEWVTTCQYLSDGRIISGGMDSLLCLWEANSNRCQQLAAHAAPISVVDVSPGTNTAVSASYDKTVRVWDVASRRAAESSCLTGHAAPVLQLVCGGGDNLISGDRGGTVIMWGLATGSTTSKLKDAHAGHVTALAWQHDASGSCTDSFFSGGQDGHLKM